MQLVATILDSIYLKSHLQLWQCQTLESNPYSVQSVLGSLKGNYQTGKIQIRLFHLPLTKKSFYLIPHLPGFQVNNLLIPTQLESCNCPIWALPLHSLIFTAHTQPHLFLPMVPSQSPAHSGLFPSRKFAWTLASENQIVEELNRVEETYFQQSESLSLLFLPAHMNSTGNLGKKGHGGWEQGTQQKQQSSYTPSNPQVRLSCWVSPEIPGHRQVT